MRDGRVRISEKWASRLWRTIKASRPTQRAPERAKGNGNDDGDDDDEDDDDDHSTVFFFIRWDWRALC